MTRRRRVLSGLRRACGAAAVAWAGAGALAAQPPPTVAFDVPPPGTLSGTPTYVYGMVQDAAGYLWVASEDGLHRYDGVDFVAFHADPDDPGAIPGNRVTGLASAPDGSVWAFVDLFGLVRHRPETGRLERYPLPPPLNLARTIAVDGDGQVWLSASGTSPAEARYRDLRLRFDPETNRVVVAPRPADVVAVRVDRAGQAWVQREDALYRRHKADGWRRYPVPGHAVWADAAVATVLVGRRVLRYDGHRDRFERVADLPASLRGRIRRALVDASGVLWTIGADGGLAATDLATGGSVRYAPDPLRPDALPGGRPHELFEDGAGVLWVATELGLRMVRPGWRTFRSDPLAASPYASMLARSPTGRVWGGGACDEPWHLDAAGRRVPLAEAAPAVARALARATTDGPFCVSSLTEAPDGSFWMTGWPFPAAGSRGALHVGRGGQSRFYSFTGAVSEAARQLHLDEAGRAWAATEDGLVELRPDGSVRRFSAETEGPGRLPVTIVWTVDAAPGGDLWVGTYGGGLVRFDPRRGVVRRVYGHDPGDAATLPSGIVTAVAPAPGDAGTLWVGTYDGGLARLDVASGRARRYTRRDGLPNLSVKSLLVDARGHLWVGTADGLVWLDPDTDATRVYTEADGLPGRVFGLYDAVRLDDGRAAMLVDGSLLTFDPASVHPTELDAPVVLRGVRVAGRARALPPPGQPIRLRPGARSLGVEVAALAFGAPVGLRYAVRLDGVDAWTPLGPDRTAAWTDLRPGRYTLRARAATASGPWSPRELVVPVVVEPRWWERSPVRGAVGALLLVGFVGLVREVSQRRLRRQVEHLRRERAAARRLQAERERISRDLHDHVGAQLSSLLAGVDLARLARRRGGRTAAAERAAADPLDAIEADARETIRQLRETIWALHHASMTVGAFCDRLRADAARLTRSPSAPTVDVDCGDCGDAVLSPMLALHLYRFAQEALANAVKHAGAGTVHVTVACADGHVDVAVQDDGTFRPSAGAGGDGAAGLSGYGMASMRARAEALGATLAVDTAGGTRVAIRAPLAAADGAPAR